MGQTLSAVRVYQDQIKRNMLPAHGPLATDSWIHWVYNLPIMTASGETVAVVIRRYHHSRDSGIEDLFVIVHCLDLSDISDKIAESTFFPAEISDIAEGISTVQEMTSLLDQRTTEHVAIAMGHHLVDERLCMRFNEVNSKIIDARFIAKYIPPLTIVDFNNVKCTISAPNSTAIAEGLRNLTQATCGGLNRAKADGELVSRLQKEFAYYKGPTFEFASRLQIAKLKGEGWAEDFNCETFDELMLWIGSALGASAMETYDAKKLVINNLIDHFEGLGRALAPDVSWESLDAYSRFVRFLAKARGTANFAQHEWWQYSSHVRASINEHKESFNEIMKEFGEATEPEAVRACMKFLQDALRNDPHLTLPLLLFVADLCGIERFSESRISDVRA